MLEINYVVILQTRYELFNIQTSLLKSLGFHYLPQNFVFTNMTASMDRDEL